MDRVNSEGWPRDQLRWVLTQPKHVAKARKRDSCLLCRSKNVNEAGLCTVCVTYLEPDELAMVERWMSGVGPI